VHKPALEWLLRYACACITIKASRSAHQPHRTDLLASGGTAGGGFFARRAIHAL